MKIDWKKHDLAAPLPVLRVFENLELDEIDEVCNWAASIILSRVEENARALPQFDVGVVDCMPVMSEMNWGHWLRRSDVLSLLESMKQNTNGDQG